jgi:N-sulfoglucosamine sulfohydrolase
MKTMNILYLHCHDAGRYIEPYGHAVATPNLQRLAQDGVMFRNAHCAGPTCSPSRAALLTGQYPHVNGMIGLAHAKFNHHLNNYKDHIIHQLHEQGYTSALAGQQHVAPDVNKIGYSEVLEIPDGPFQELDSRVVQTAADWIKQGHEKPFFLSVGLFFPHRDFLEADPSKGNDEDWRYVKVPPTLPDNEQTRRDIADYNCSAKYMDRNYGIVLDALKEAGLEDNTLIIATTDHGIAFPHMKCNLTDHGTGVFMILRGPNGFSGGKCVDAMVSHLDIYPTICELLGIHPSHDLHGKSLIPLVSGEQEELHEEIFSEVTYHAAYEPKRAIRTKRYKLIKRFDPDCTTQVMPNCDDGYSKTCLCDYDWAERQKDQLMLFDLIYDPAESNNLSNDDRYASVLEELENRLNDWMVRTDDPLLAGPVPLPDGCDTTPIAAFSPYGDE